MTDHPHHLLAEFADDALSPPERGEVEAHLAGCARCREELAVARGARMALAALPEVPAPAGLATPALQRARPDRRLWRGLSWAAAATSAAAAVVIAAVVVSGGGGGSTAARAPAAERGAASAEGASPAFSSSGRDYDRAELSALAGRLGSRTTLTGASPLQTDSAASAETPAAAACIRAAGLAGSADQVLVYLEAARFEGRPAYIAAVRGPDGGITVTAVARDGCDVLASVPPSTSASP